MVEGVSMEQIWHVYHTIVFTMPPPLDIIILRGSPTFITIRMLYLRGGSLSFTLEGQVFWEVFSLIMTLHLLWQKLELVIRIITQIQLYSGLSHLLY